MITLIKIRRKYLSNHYCSVFWSYFFIPNLILIILIPYLLIERKEKYSEKNKIEGKVYNKTIELFSQNINSDKYNISLVSNDEQDKKILQELFKNDIEWFNQDSEVHNKNPIIEIINENERYQIKLFQNQENIIFNHSLKTFSYSNSFEPPNKDIYDFKYFNEFIKLQSLLAQFLIKKKGNSYSQKELIIEIGDNSYPPYTDIVINYIIGLNIIISLQFSLISYFFCMKMIEEKEKKLIELLERQGISKKDYFFSWLFTYLFIIIIPVITYILFYFSLSRLNY